MKKIIVFTLTFSLSFSLISCRVFPQDISSIISSNVVTSLTIEENSSLGEIPIQEKEMEENILSSKSTFVIEESYPESISSETVVTNETESSTSVTNSNNTDSIVHVVVGIDENGNPITKTYTKDEYEKWMEYISSEEYLLANGRSSERTTYTASLEYIVSTECPNDEYTWTAVDFWWEPVAWDSGPYCFEWEVYCNYLDFESAKGNALEYMPSCPTYQESYNLYKSGTFKFGLTECDKYGTTTLYVRKVV